MDGINAMPGRSFFSTPTGKVKTTGYIVTAVLITAIFWFFGGPIGDYAVNAIDNIVHLGIMLGVLFGIVVLCFNPKAQLIYYAIMHAIASGFCRIAPIEIIEACKSKMNTRLGKLTTSLGDLKGLKEKTLRLKKEKLAKKENSMRMIEAAKRAGDDGKAEIQLRDIVRTEKWLERYEEDLNRETFMIYTMDRIRTICVNTIADMDNEITDQKEKQKYSGIMGNIMSNASAILNGGEEKEMWDESIMVLQDQYDNTLGQIDNFLDMTKGMIAQDDLQNDVNNQKAQELFNGWMNKDTNAVIGSGSNQVSKASIIQDAAKSLTGKSVYTQPQSKQNVQVNVANGSDNDYLSTLK